jgi:hypothetical protein
MTYRVRGKEHPGLFTLVFTVHGVKASNP